MVFDGTQTTNATRLSVYFSGMPIALTFFGTIPATLTNSVGPLRFGTGFNRYWLGAMDDVRLYNRALSAQEVSEVWGASLLGYREGLQWLRRHQLLPAATLPPVVIEFTARLAGTSSTPAVLLTQGRVLPASLSGTSTTPTSAVTTLRSLSSNLTGGSTTAASLVTQVRPLPVTLQAASTTPASVVSLTGRLTSALTGTSVTADAVAELLTLRSSRLPPRRQYDVYQCGGDAAQPDE